MRISSAQTHRATPYASEELKGQAPRLLGGKGVGYLGRALQSTTVASGH